MNDLSVIIADPDLKVVETPDCLSLCSGIMPDYWANGNDWLSSPDEVGRVCAACGDATVLQIRRSGDDVTQVRAWRAAFTCHELFYTRTQSGFLFADHLRNILAEMPLERRRVADNALVDFLIFRCAPGQTAYCDGVRRVMPGERLTIDLRTGAIDSDRFDAISGTTVYEPVRNYVDRIDAAFDAVTEQWRNADGVVSLFSGGIDSTLVQSYLGSEVPAVTGMAWNLKDFEKDYAVKAARLLNIRHRTFGVQEDEFLPLLESAIEISGQPPLFDQIVIFYKAFQQMGHTFVSGCAADSTFGLDELKGGTARVGRLLAKMPGGNVAASFLPAEGKGRMGRIGAMSNQLARPLEDAEGYAARILPLTHMPMVERVFGPRHVAQRLAHRVEIALPAIEFASPPNDRIGRQLELAHWAIVLTDDGHRQLRHLAHGLGKTYVSPFMTRTVADASLRVPVSRRYVRGSHAKYLLKDLLKRRLPNYPVGQRKGASLFGVENFFRQGPLEDLWERYPLPDCFIGRDRADFLEYPSLLHWNVAAFCIWRDRVLLNGDLKLTPGIRRFAGFEEAARSRGNHMSWAPRDN